MPVSILDAPGPVAALTPSRVPQSGGMWAHDSAHLLQRTQALIDEVPADPRYWTAYDHFMLERQARALRRAYLGAIFDAAWSRLRAAFRSR
jgi:hypothetical protein